MDVNKGGDCSFGQEEVGGTCANIRVHSTKIPDQIFNQSQTNSPEIISFMILMTMGRPLTMAEPLLPALLTCGFSQIVFSGQSGGVGEREGQEGVSEFKGGHLSLIVTCHCWTYRKHSGIMGPGPKTTDKHQPWIIRSPRPVVAKTNRPQTQSCHYQLLS